jgi:phosphoenolpyruvate synthase/pyruvate phosphate dikinase
MKKILMILAVASLASVVNTSCDLGDLDTPLVIENIPVEPGDWQRALDENGAFTHYYCDIELPEITEATMRLGDIQTYFVREEEREGEAVTVQEKLPYTDIKERWNDDKGENESYEEIIAASYEIGYMRITIRRANFIQGLPENTLKFRVVISM